MTVFELLRGLGPEFTTLDAAGVVVVAMTPDAPTVGSTLPPDHTQRLLRLILNHGDWSNTKEMDYVH